MKKTVFVLSVFIAIILLSFTFPDADQPRYKNLKILSKNTNKEQMDSIMKHFSTSLGVKCSFCHVFNQEQKAMDFANDGNEHKLVARDMMRMTNKINKKYFKGEIDKRTNLQATTCYTCHHGQAHPAGKPGAQAGRPSQQGGQPPMQGPPPANNKE